MAKEIIPTLIAVVLVPFGFFLLRQVFWVPLQNASGDIKKLREKLDDLENDLIRIQEFNAFLSRTMLKNAVLEFHNPHPDELIDKIQRNEPLTSGEKQRLEDKLQDVASTAPSSVKRMKAINALELFRQVEIFEAAIKRRERARDDLFNE